MQDVVGKLVTDPSIKNQTLDEPSEMLYNLFLLYTFYL